MKKVKMKKVNFIYSRNKLDFKKFLKEFEYDEVISYYDIVTKLIKNDKNNDKPSENVINTYIIRKIFKILSSEDNSVILYAISEINENLLNSICKLMIEKSNTSIEFNFITLCNKKFNITCEENILLENNKYIENIKVIEYND